jgi:hypothetical protein
VEKTMRKRKRVYVEEKWNREKKNMLREYTT